MDGKFGSEPTIHAGVQTAMGSRNRSISHWIFADEAGDFKNHPYLVMGMIRTTTPTTHEEALERICSECGISSEVKYSSTDRRTLALRKLFIDYFCDEDDLEFRCIVKSRDHHDLTRYQNNHLGIPAKDMAYNHTYQNFLSNNLSGEERAIIFIDDKSRTAGDNLIPYLQCNVARAADVQPKDSKELRLLQMADLLTGCVFGSLTGNSHPVKSEVHQYLLDRRGLRTLAYKCPGTKFNIWHWRPRR